MYYMTLQIGPRSEITIALIHNFIVKMLGFFHMRIREVVTQCMDVI